MGKFKTPGWFRAFFTVALLWALVETVTFINSVNNVFVDSILNKHFPDVDDKLFYSGVLFAILGIVLFLLLSFTATRLPLIAQILPNKNDVFSHEVSLSAINEQEDEALNRSILSVPDNEV